MPLVLVTHQEHQQGGADRRREATAQGLILRLSRSNAKATLFTTGKIGFSGAKSERDIHEALDEIFPILVRHRKDGESPAL